MDWAKGCVDCCRKIDHLVLDSLGKFGVIMPERRYPHIEMSVVHRGVRGGMVGSGGDRSPSIGLGTSPGKSSGGRRRRAGMWGGHGWGSRRVRLITEVRNLNCVVPGGSLDSCVSSLVLLLQGPKFRLVPLKAGLQGCFGRFGGGEGDVGFVGGGHQALVMLVMFIVCQIGGVARCRRLGIANAGLDV